MAATADSLWTDNILEGALTSDNAMQGDMTPARNVTYALVGEAGARVLLNINSADYKITAILQDKDGNTIYTSNVIDLPLESMVVSGSYDSTTKKVILTLQNGNTVEFSIADLVDGLVSFTDYANESKAGVIKSNNASYGTNVSPTSGVLYGSTKTYQDYQSFNANGFISKGTLENVITGKGLVSNTNYATDVTAGVIKSSNNNYATSVSSSSGVLYAVTKTYSEYTSGLAGMFISKGTLENVLTAKIGDIEEALQSI